MEENNNLNNGERKVLISVKVSTLLIILLVIIIAIVAFVKISKSGEKQEPVQQTVHSMETKEEKAPIKEPIKITARSSGPE